ncbi:MAG: LamG domain-containing protein [Planctomycetota bacterium]|jgi:hypothetical protein|nr:LamG domain-containing protein [Planctomycetota bacterium]
MDRPKSAWREAVSPRDFPGLVAFWDMQGRGAARGATAGEAYVLEERAGTVERVLDTGAPFGAYAAHVREGQYFGIPRSACDRLDIHGLDGHLTVVAWVRRAQTKHGGCEFLAGQWNETELGRQYGLFINIGVWGGSDQVCGHVSATGGATTGYRYCMDGAIGSTPVPCDEWHVVAMSYDGIQAYAWLDGLLDARPGVNPYPMGGGLHDGGPKGSDFTVCAVDRSGEMGNFFAGLLGGLAVYDRALSPAEMWALCTPMPS